MEIIPLQTNFRVDDKMVRDFRCLKHTLNKAISFVSDYKIDAMTVSGSAFLHKLNEIS